MALGTRVGIKDNSRRKYPGIGGRRHNPVGVEVRRASAKERQDAYSQLTAQEKLDLLDRKLGRGVGAAKQRARLAAELKPAKKTKA